MSVFLQQGSGSSFVRTKQARERREREREREREEGERRFDLPIVSVLSGSFVLERLVVRNCINMESIASTL